MVEQQKRKQSEEQERAGFDLGSDEDEPAGQNAASSSEAAEPELTAETERLFEADRDYMVGYEFSGLGQTKKEAAPLQLTIWFYKGQVSNMT